MSKIVSFRIGKGRTFRPSEEEEWTRKYLELEIQLPTQFTEEGFWEAVTRAEAMIDKFLGAPEVGYVPQLEPATLDALPWKTRDGSPAKEEAWGWVYGPGAYTGAEQGTADLIKALNATKDGKIVVGNYEYSFAKDKAFIQRRPIKIRG